MDERLDGGTRAEVEAHLRTCARCREEYAALKSLVQEVGDLPKAGAPDDFLESLHRRMESESSIRKIISALFVPFRIKIPLELLTAAAAAVLIFFLVNVQQKEQPVSDMLSMEKAEKPKALLSARGGAEKNQAPSSPGKPAPIMEQEAESTEPSIRKKTSAYDTKQWKSTSPDAEDKTEAVPSTETPIQLALVMDPLSEMLTGRAAEGGGQEIQPDSEPLSEAKEAGPDGIDRITSVVKNHEGRIISIHYDDATRRPESVLADIPASRFAAFYEQLKQLGRFRQPMPAVDADENAMVQVKILLISELLK